jgi:phytoene dehydrogenase-like protein
MAASLIHSDTQLNQKSYYEASAERGDMEPVLLGAVDADVVIVGAGFSGLSAALELAQRGLSVVVLEADRIGSGASGRNGGQVIVGYASGQAPFEEQLGSEDAQRAWEMSVEAVELVDQRVRQFGIDCDWMRGYTYVAETRAKARALREEADDHERRGVACEWVEGNDAVQSLVKSPSYVAWRRRPARRAFGSTRAPRSQRCSAARSCARSHHKGWSRPALACSQATACCPNTGRWWPPRSHRASCRWAPTSSAQHPSIPI